MPKFSKDHRYTLGFKVDSLFVEITEILYGAQYAQSKQKQLYLEKASFKLDALKFFLQILWEIKGIDNKKYTHLSNHLNETGRMLGGWIKDTHSKNQTF